MAVTLFGLSLVPSMDLDGAEYVLVGYLFAVPGLPCFLLAVAARHPRSERERKALIGAFAGVLPTLLVYAPLLQEHPRSVDGPLMAGMFIYWLPLFLPLSAGIGAALALLWPVRAQLGEWASGKRRRYGTGTVDRRVVAWRSSLFLATLGIALGVGFAVVVWLVYTAWGTLAPLLWAIVMGSPTFAVGLLAVVFRTRHAFYGLAGALFGGLSAPLGLALMVVDLSDQRSGGFNFPGLLIAFGPLFVVGMMALGAAAGRRWYRLQCGEPSWSLPASD